jgi:hypothetical protein
MRLAKAGLVCKKGNAQRGALNFAQQLHTEALVHLGKIHMWKIRQQAQRRLVRLRLKQTDFGRFGFILRAHVHIHQNEGRIIPGGH